MKISKNSLNVLLIAIVSIIMSGCATMKSGAESVAQVPSLENQANRIVIGMGLVRLNTVIANMPISADATWPDELNDDLVFEDNKQTISDALDDDPYVATHEYTDLYQKTQLGGFTFLSQPRIGALTYTAVNKMLILYGPNEDNWPTFFDIETDLSTFHKFKNGQVKQVEALNSNVYENLNEALISLMPVNYQKDLHDSREEMLDAYLEVAELKALKGEYETQIESNGVVIEDIDGSTSQELNDEELLELKEKTLELETQISEKELGADEKETIYTTLLEEATEALTSDISLSEEDVALAKNIILASGSIKTGALEAGGAFALTTTILATTEIVQDFPKELQTLAVARIHIPYELEDLYDQRVLRIGENALYSLPAIAIGTYYAIKQAFLAEQYETIAEIIVEADELEKEAERNRLIEEQRVRAELVEQGQSPEEETTVDNEVPNSVENEVIPVQENTIPEEVL